MEWFIKNYKDIKDKYPNVYKDATKKGGVYQAESTRGDLSGMHKTKESAIL